MALGVLLLLGVFAAYVIAKIVENLSEPFPPFESPEEFWDYHLKHSQITDPVERRRFEAETKRKMIARQKEKERQR